MHHHFQLGGVKFLFGSLSFSDQPSCCFLRLAEHQAVGGEQRSGNCRAWGPPGGVQGVGEVAGQEVAKNGSRCHGTFLLVTS